MKKLLVFLIALLFTGTLVAQNLKLEDILEKTFKATGQDNLLKVQSIRLTMKAVQQGQEFILIMSTKQPNSRRLEMELQGTKVIFAFDGQTGWMINPAMGSLDPQDVPETMLKEFKDNSDTFLNWSHPFFNWKEKGNKIELSGLENLNGTQVYNIRITLQDGDVYNYYVDAAKFVVVKESTTDEIQGMAVTEDVIYSDFREVDGILFAYKMETLYNGQTGGVMTIDKCEFNALLEDSLFTKPAPATN